MNDHHFSITQGAARAWATRLGSDCQRRSPHRPAAVRDLRGVITPRYATAYQRTDWHVLAASSARNRRAPRRNHQPNQRYTRNARCCASCTAIRRPHTGATTASTSIRGIDDFRSAVPINTYEELRPYVDAVANGTDPHALTADRVEMFTNTSGTTSKPKLVPVTASSRAAERRVKNAWLAYLAAAHPGVLRGKAFYLFNNAEEYRTPSGLWVGSNAGLMYRNSSSLLRSAQAVPYEVCLIEDYESRYYVILRHILAADISMLACINPSSILLLAELANQHADALIQDIYAGTCARGWPFRSDSTRFSASGCAPTAAAPRAGAPAGGGRPPDAVAVLAASRGAVLVEGAGRQGVHRALPGLVWRSAVPRRGLRFVRVPHGSGALGLRLAELPLPDNYFYEFIPEEDRVAYLNGSRRAAAAASAGAGAAVFDPANGAARPVSLQHRGHRRGQRLPRRTPRSTSCRRRGW